MTGKETLENLKTYCDAMIALMEESIENAKLLGSRKRRFMMGEICGVEKVRKRISRMIREEQE